ncbi:hypothetical protein BX616_008546 [Lobosporangium transversale]|nr:hypothetical protein BX616_008546 [Lobosporangium transversale]
MDIKHYPHQRDDQGRIRIVFVVAFGNRNLAGVDAGESELSVVESWQKIKVAEAYISDKLPAPISRNSEDTTGPQLISFRPQPARGKVETIVPHNTQQTIRGRIIKLYSVKDPLTAEIQDHIALIGILQGSRAQTVVMTSPLFVSKTPKQLSARDGTSMTRDETITPKQLSARDGTSMTRDETIMTTPSTAAPTQSKWTCHALGGGTRALSTSCMSLFPPQSDFEHLLVIMDQGGNAQIWDWLRKLRVAVLKAPESGADTASQGQERASVSRNELFYWGVQINWAIEEPVFQDQKPNSPFLSHRKHGDFRIVALADGQDKEWETSTWFVSEKELRKREEVLSNLQEGEKFESWELNAKYRYFQQSTLGRRYIPGASPETITSTSSQVQELLFIAYLIWDHYRISLTSNNGICIFDMNQECGKAAATFSNSSVHTPLPEPPQWVTYLDNAEEDPLVDIAAVGDALFLTRKHSHMIWPFRSVVVEE